MAYSGPGTVLYNNVPVLQAKTAELDFESGNNDVDTLALGRAGHSRGAKKVTLSVTNAIPQLGYEVDWAGIEDAQLEIPLGFRIANKTYQMIGDVRSVKVKTDTNSANDISFTFHGRVLASFVS